MSQLLTILKAEGKRILDEFKLASEQGKGTAQEIADFRENAVHNFLSRSFPVSHIVSKGKITDLEGTQSSSIDCLILNPAHPNLIDSKGKFRLIFADGCDAAIEVKPDLARRDELRRGIEQGISVKKTKRSESSLYLPMRQPPCIVEHSLYIPFYIFTVKRLDPLALYRKISHFYQTEKITKGHQIDGIFIADLGIVANIKHKERNPYGAPPPVGENDGWYFEAWGEATPVGLLLHLHDSLPSFPIVATPIMMRALRKLGGGIRFVRLGDSV